MGQRLQPPHEMIRSAILKQESKVMRLVACDTSHNTASIAKNRLPLHPATKEK